jgi:thiol-disulfide isomerase/thioredoxin
MALTPSSMLPLGTCAPDFKLPDVVSGNEISLQSVKSSVGTVIIFMCNHCPFVKHVLPKLIEVAENYTQKSLQFIAINSNDIENFPDDSPEKMRALAMRSRFCFPYLFDESQAIAKAYQAACTPDYYLFDKNLRCVYRGRFDESTPGNNVPLTGKDLCQAIDNLLGEKPISDVQLPSMGCSIKWKA